MQGDLPWDEKDFRYLVMTVAGVGSFLLYLLYRDNGREITWKDFVHRYIGRGVVRRGRGSRRRSVCEPRKSNLWWLKVCVRVSQVDRLEVINKQYVRVFLEPGVDADTVRWSAAR